MTDDEDNKTICGICGCKYVEQDSETVRCARCQTILAVKLRPEAVEELDKDVDEAIHTIPNHIQDYEEDDQE